MSRFPKVLPRFLACATLACAAAGAAAQGTGPGTALREVEHDVARLRAEAGQLQRELHGLKQQVALADGELGSAELLMVLLGAGVVVFLGVRPKEATRASPADDVEPPQAALQALDAAPASEPLAAVAASVPVVAPAPADPRPVRTAEPVELRLVDGWRASTLPTAQRAAPVDPISSLPPPFDEASESSWIGFDVDLEALERDYGAYAVRGGAAGPSSRAAALGPG